MIALDVARPSPPVRRPPSLGGNADNYNAYKYIILYHRKYIITRYKVSCNKHILCVYSGAVDDGGENGTVRII